jgi:hypothetical protein
MSVSDVPSLDNFAERREGITAFMNLVAELGDPAKRKELTHGGRDLTGIPSRLQEALRAMSDCELAVLARLKNDLDAEGFWDQYDPKLYYF